MKRAKKMQGKRVCIWFDDKTIAIVKELAIEEDRSMSAVLRTMLKERHKKLYRKG